MKILATVMLLVMATLSFGYVSQGDSPYFEDVLVRGALTAPFEESVLYALEVTTTLEVDSIALTGDMSILGDTNVVVTGYLKGDSLATIGGATVGGVFAVTGASTLTGATDVVGALTAGSMTSDANVTATDTLFGAALDISGNAVIDSALSVGTDATIAGDITGADSVEVTDLDVSNDAIIDGTLTSASYNFATAAVVGGTGDVITMDFTPDMPAPAAGMMITFVAEAANTGATTLNVDGTGAVAVVEASDGSALEAGDIANGSVVIVVHDGTSWQQVSQSGN